MGVVRSGQRQDPLGDSAAFGLHAGHRFFDSKGVPELERPDLPAEAPDHAPVDLGDVRADLGDAVGRVDEASGQEVPPETGGGVIEGDEGANALHRVGDLVGLGQARLPRVLPRLVLERGRVDHQGALLPEEATTGLLAQIALGHHVEDPLRELPLLAHLVIGGGGVVGSHRVSQDVRAGQVGGPVGGGDRTGEGPAARRVHFLDGQPVLVHGVDGVHRGEHPDAVGHEVRPVVAEDHALAQPQFGEVLESGDHAWVGLFAGDELQEVHIARREEEVGAEEAGLESLGQVRRHGVDGEPRRVGGHDGVRADDLCHPRQQVLLDVELLDDRFHHPVDVGQFGQVVVEVAGGEQCRAAGVSERGRPPLERRGDGRLGQAVPHRFALQRELLLLFFFGQRRRRHIQKKSGDARVGQVGGYRRSHASGAQHRSFTDHQHSQPPRGSWLVKDEAPAPGTH